MNIPWTQYAIDVLLARDPLAIRGDGITPCVIVAEHFDDARFRRIDYVLHELSHLLTYPESTRDARYYLALAALNVGDGGLTSIVSELSSKLSSFQRTVNERTAIELCATFWLAHDSKFPVESYITGCIKGQSHEAEFAEIDIQNMIREVRESVERSDHRLNRQTSMERLYDAISAFDLRAGARAANGFAVGAGENPMREL